MNKTIQLKVQPKGTQAGNQQNDIPAADIPAAVAPKAEVWVFESHP